MSKNAILRAPPGSRLRPDAPLNQLRLAVTRALLGKIGGATAWLELAMITNSEEAIGARGLFEERNFRDEKYVADVHFVVDHVLGLHFEQLYEDGAWFPHAYPLHLVTLEEHLDLPAWLAEHEPRLHRLLYGADPAEAAALDAVTTTIADLELPNIVRQLDRLRRDLADDLPAAIGHAKDLVESACKTVLGETGAGAGSKKLPPLVAAALRAAGLHADQVDLNDPDAQLLRALLISLQRQLDSVAGLRNRVGTGHGRAGVVPVDDALARLVIGQALHAVAYLLRVADLNTIDGGTADSVSTMVIDGGTA